MSKFRKMLADVPPEIIRVWCKPIPFPVDLQLPEAVKDTLPLGTVKNLIGIRVLRFYCPPSPGHTIAFRGHVWGVIGIHHELQMRGSSKPDQIPTVLTQYVGKVTDVEES